LRHSVYVYNTDDSGEEDYLSPPEISMYDSSPSPRPCRALEEDLMPEVKSRDEVVGLCMDGVRTVEISATV